MPKKVKKHSYVMASGKRKTSSARVRLHKGEGQHMVNNFPIGQYFPGASFKALWSRPFTVTETEGKYFITAKVAGGGRRSQLEAVALGIARSLAKANAEKYKKALKTNGLLTRDARERERRKVGTGGKARRKKQSPKR